MKFWSTGMCLANFRRPKILTGILLVTLLVCLTVTKRHWMDTEFLQSNLIYLKEKAEGLIEYNRPTAGKTIVPSNVPEKAQPEKGQYNFTVVTAMMDIGRGSWRFKSRMVEIMASEEYKKDNQLVALGNCEATILENDILQLSKIIIWENPFSTSYFMWMDGGYGHGYDIFPKDNVWIPKDLLEFSDKVTSIERPPGIKQFEKDINRLLKLNINIMAGGFLAGGAEALKELCKMQRNLVDEWMKIGIVKYDQTVNIWMFYRKPSLFRLVTADWYDVFKLVNRNTTERIKQ